MLTPKLRQKVIEEYEEHKIWRIYYCINTLTNGRNCKPILYPITHWHEDRIVLYCPKCGKELINSFEDFYFI